MPILDPLKEHPATGLRLPTDDQIAYFLVGPKDDNNNTIPELLQTYFLHSLGDLPKSGIQIFAPLRYQRVSISQNNAQPVRFKVIFEDNFSGIASYVANEPALLKVFFWISAQQSALKALNKIKGNILVIPGSEDIKTAMLTSGLLSEYIGTDFTQIIEKIRKIVLARTELTDSELAKRMESINALLKELHENVFSKSVLRFRPIHVNRRQIQQIYGQFDFHYWEDKDKNDFSQRTKELIASFDAVTQTLLIISHFEHDGRKYFGWLPAGILAFPSNNPLEIRMLTQGLSKLSPELRGLAKSVLAVRSAEQDSTTYVNQITTPEGGLAKEAIEFGAANAIDYLGFLDAMGYLHGSFHAAPYLRAPLKGKSLAMHHSAFAPGHFSVHATPASKNKMINRFSKALSTAVHDDFRDKIKEYHGGFVVLSDLPIEWLDCDGVPLCFLQDICRIPETVPTNILSHFSRNWHTSYQVTASTPTRTLVICGAPDDDQITAAFETMSEFWKAEKAPWQWERCLSVSKLITLLNEFRPELLIFDTHGRFRDNEQGSEIQIGKEWLNGKDVINHFPQIPLVMLSTCWGAPLYGHSNTIAHAFFEAGTLAITTSMLPLDVLNGSGLYARVLKNLVYACTHGIHRTWSSFMSHNIRTSLFDDMKNRVRRHYRNRMVDLNVYTEIRTQWQIETMSHDTRASAYHSTSEMVSKCFHLEVSDRIKKIYDTKSYVPEFMYYSTMGRADLIQFESWNKEHHNPNPLQNTIHQFREAAMKMSL